MKTVQVVAAIFHKRGQVFVTQRGYGSFKGYWEFPGGKIEPGETPQQALKREIAEELDAEISVGEKLCQVEYDYPDFHLSMACFEAQVASGDLKLLEHMDAAWVGDPEIRTLAWLPADQPIIDVLEERGLI